MNHSGITYPPGFRLQKQYRFVENRKIQNQVHLQYDEQHDIIIQDTKVSARIKSYPYMNKKSKCHDYLHHVDDCPFHTSLKNPAVANPRSPGFQYLLKNTVLILHIIICYKFPVFAFINFLFRRIEKRIIQFFYWFFILLNTIYTRINYTNITEFMDL